MKINEMKEIINEIKTEFYEFGDQPMGDHESVLFMASALKINFYISCIKQNTRKAEIERILNKVIRIRNNFFLKWFPKKERDQEINRILELLNF